MTNQMIVAHRQNGMTNPLQFADVQRKTTFIFTQLFGAAGMRDFHAFIQRGTIASIVTFA